MVGQPLDLAFDVVLDPGADAASACIGAELFFGDTRIDPSRVRVTARAGSQPSQAVVQVVTSAAVNEPVVSVMVRAGCSPAVSRRYVLLASSPVEAVAPAGSAARALPVAPGGTSWSGTVTTGRPLAPLRRVPSASAPAADSVAGSGTRSSAASSAKSETRRRAAGPVESPRPADTGRGNARLELQSPMEWLQEQALPLRGSTAMAAPALATTAEQRATAAALWRSLNAPSADGGAPSDAETQQRVQALEGEIKKLQSGVRVARSMQTQLEAQLGDAKRERDMLWFVLWPLAGVVVLLALGGAALLLRRRRGEGAERPVRASAKRGTPWWKPRRPVDFGAETAPGFAEGFVDTQPSLADATLPPEVPQSQPPSRVVHADQPVFAATKYPVAAAPVAVAVQPRVASTSAEAAARAARELRSSSADALADVQQNAEFFASLGQYDQAIELLQEYIAAHPGTSPLAYLDLLKLFHTLSLTDPYRTLRAEFNELFNADAPPFASFLKTSRDLVAYPEVLQRISEAWTQPQVLDLIESLLVRQAGEGAHPSFQLEAYRDLLLLYEIAKTLHGTAGTAGAVPKPAALAPVATGAAVAAAMPAVTPAPVYPSHDAAPIDLPLEPPPAPRMTPAMSPPEPPVAMADLGVPLDFTTPHDATEPPATDGFLLPDLELMPPSPAPAPAAATPADDPHLIDFDMFEIAVPTADKPPKA